MCDVATAITGIASIAGLGMSVAGTSEQNSAIKEMNEAQQQELGIRKQQLQLEQMQSQRQMLRQASLARSTAITNAQGGTGSVQGSGVMGAMGAIQSNLGTNWGYNTTGVNLGMNMLNSQSQYANAQMNYQLAGGMERFGADIFGSASTMGRLGSTLYGTNLFGGGGGFGNSWKAVAI